MNDEFWFEITVDVVLVIATALIGWFVSPLVWPLTLMIVGLLIYNIYNKGIKNRK